MVIDPAFIATSDTSGQANGSNYVDELSHTTSTKTLLEIGLENEVAYFKTSIGYTHQGTE